jgi:hypothetical protein
LNKADEIERRQVGAKQFSRPDMPFLIAVTQQFIGAQPGKRACSPCRYRSPTPPAHALSR